MAQDLAPPSPLTETETEKRLAAIREIPFDRVPSPAYVIHMDCLEDNCRLLQTIAERSGTRILLALKGFACHSTFPQIRQYLAGTTSSGRHEALLAHECFGKETHVYSVAYKPSELKELSRFAHTLVFNSPRQLAAGIKTLEGHRRPEIGLRVNPGHCGIETELYNPCLPASRLGVSRSALDQALADLPAGWLKQINGLHFHALCQQDADALEYAIQTFEANFSDLFPSLDLSWVNFGGGHHITRPGYDIDRLLRTIGNFRKRHDLNIYLEPGEAVALHTGVLVTTILDIVKADDQRIALIDSSATCHTPDVLEMPYRPNILGADTPGKHPHTYRIGGISCLAGDIFGDYSFPCPLEVGQTLVFLDMAHYTMVKNTTFNGVPLPAICFYEKKAGLRIVRRFGYEDYRNRLS